MSTVALQAIEHRSRSQWWACRFRRIFRISPDAIGVGSFTCRARASHPVSCFSGIRLQLRPSAARSLLPYNEQENGRRSRGLWCGFKRSGFSGNATASAAHSTDVLHRSRGRRTLYPVERDRPGRKQTPVAHRSYAGRGRLRDVAPVRSSLVWFCGSTVVRSGNPRDTDADAGSDGRHVDVRAAWGTPA